MKKIIISVLGKDRPGIIAAVTDVLFKQECNIENVSQTILQNEFSGIFIVSAQRTTKQLLMDLELKLSPMGLHVYLKPLDNPEESLAPAQSEPFVITTRGPDKKGLVARITKVLAAYNVNVTNLQAAFKGGSDPDDNIMIYEVDIPMDIDQGSLRKDLREQAKELELDISLQHKKIFEAINRV